jgi:hypothetical protein
MTLETLALKGRNIGLEMAGNLAESSYFHATLGIFYMPKICDMGQDGFTSISKGSRAEDFFFPP